MKKHLFVLVLVVLGFVTAVVAGSGECTRCDCSGWVQKSKYHGSAGEAHAYCKCGHFWSSHK